MKSVTEDIYAWVRSPEIRTFLRGHHAPTLMEKTAIVCGSFKSVEEKYAMLKKLRHEAVEAEEKEALGQLICLHEWFFEELEKDRSGQVFVCGQKQPSDDIGNLETRDYIDNLFCSCEDVFRYLKEAEQSWDMGEGEGFWVGKHVPVDGEMEEIIGMDFYYTDDALKLVTFWPGDERNLHICEKLGIDFETRELHEWRGLVNYFPLPFQSGDLVRLDPPPLDDPAYGVLYMYDNPSDRRYMWLYYLRDGLLCDCSMSYCSIGSWSPWRVIDWMHPAVPSELPPGHEILAELSKAFHEAGPNSDEGERLFFKLRNLPAPAERKIPLTLSEML